MIQCEDNENKFEDENKNPAGKEENFYVHNEILSLCVFKITFPL